MNNQDQLMDLCFEALFISVSAQLVSIPVPKKQRERAGWIWYGTYNTLYVGCHQSVFSLLERDRASGIE